MLPSTPEANASPLLSSPRQSIVESDAGSSLRRTSQRMLPTYARYLRAVGKAAPVIGALSTGRDAESLLGEEYGGTAGATPAQTSPVTAVYSAVGRVSFGPVCG